MPKSLLLFLLKTMEDLTYLVKHRAKPTGQTNHAAGVLPTRVCIKAELSFLPSVSFTTLLLPQTPFCMALTPQKHISVNQHPWHMSAFQNKMWHFGWRPTVSPIFAWIWGSCTVQRAGRQWGSRHQHQMGFRLKHPCFTVKTAGHCNLHHGECGLDDANRA